MSSMNNNSHVEKIENINYHHLYDNGDCINPYGSDVICLSAGTFGPTILKKCIPMMEEATKHRMILEKDNAYLFQYGSYQGLWECRDQLSKFLTRHYGETVNRQDLIITGGATHGLELVLSTLLSTDGIIFIEETIFMDYFEIFKLFPSMKVIAVPMNDEGIDTKAFEKIVACEKSKRTWELTEMKIFWAMLLAVPVFHNPTGIIYSEKCCKEILRISREMNILVLAEDVYNLLYYGNEKYPPRRLFSYDRYSGESSGGNVISSGTFSKILAPGIRLGWIEAGPRIAKVLTNVGILKSAGAINHYTSGIVASILELGLMDTHTKLIISILKESMSIACKVLDEFLPNTCSYKRPNGGMFIWIQLPHLVDAAKFIHWCIEKHRVNAHPGNLFSIEGKFKNCMRIGIAFYQANVLKEGAERLCMALVNYLENKIIV